MSLIKEAKCYVRLLRNHLASDEKIHNMRKYSRLVKKTLVYCIKEKSISPKNYPPPLSILGFILFLKISQSIIAKSRIKKFSQKISEHKSLSSPNYL